ncbi:glutamate 5-kinase [Patulibacter sp. SYSU D01012]|uniref:glutamate 5-kinase n=1 Tax=Patulibacter sp. SYSU D01012 TaxID=2817381 RepID=UPI001B3160E0|nr:glutamate 5-kinase [Patulibacter sp. SYSU D01012]
MSLTVIKLGSSVVVDEDGALRRDSLASLVATLAVRHGAGERFVLVSSGAIARGVRELGLAARPTTMDALQAASAVGQGRLFRDWDDLFAAEGRTAAQVLLTRYDLGDREAFVNARRTLHRLVELGAVPVINENDTTTTEEISFGDNDLLAAQIAMLLGADRLVLLTSTDGLFTADPRRDPDARLVDEVRDVEQALADHDVGTTTSSLGTGGMRSKALAADMAAAAGIPTVVANGLRPDAIRRVLAGEAEGTRFVAGDARWSSFKLWLRYARPSRGTIEIDAGARRALTAEDTSLLPVGVVGVTGDFKAGDAVEIRCAGEAVAKGISGYASGALRRVAGERTARVRELLPTAPEEAVHRDRLVLL